MTYTLYRHYNEDDVLLYVGVSMRVLLRTVAHARSSSWFKDVNYITLEHFVDRTSVLAAEAKAIGLEDPKHNILMKPVIKKKRFNGSYLYSSGKIRNKMIVYGFSRGRTLQSLGDEFGISRERIRQIIARFGKIKGGIALQRHRRSLERR